jgi:general secretion pathway protein G
MDNGIVLQIVAALVALLVVVGLARIYAAAILPVLRNRQLARRGLSDEPAYRRRHLNIVHLLFRLVPAILVLAVLAAIAIPAFQDYTVKAQDKQRIADIGLIQVALDYYHLDHNAYPVSETQTSDAAGFAAALDSLVTDGYLARLPSDPGGGTYRYQSTADGTYYCLGADVEGPPPPPTCDTATLGNMLEANYAVGP